MADKRKAALAIGGLGLAGLLGYLLLRKPPPPLPEEVAATVKIEVFTLDFIPVPHSSPVILVEGESYIISITVTNQSVKAGVPYGAELYTTYFAGTPLTTFISTQVNTRYYAAGASHTYNRTIAVPLGTAGESGGHIIARVYDPTVTLLLAQAMEPITITSIVEAISYAASVSIGVT